MGTLFIRGLSKHDAWLFSKDDGSVDGRHGSDAVTEVPLGFVHVVGAFPASAGVLAVDGVDAQPAWAHT